MPFFGQELFVHGAEEGAADVAAAYRKALATCRIARAERSASTRS